MTQLVKMPDGSIVDLDDPSQLKTRALKQLAAQPRTASVDPEVKRRADAHESGAEDHWWSLGSFGRKLQDNVARPLGHGLMLGFDDEIRGGIHAAGNAVGNLVGLGNGESIGQDYVHQRDTERELQRRADARHPVIAPIAELGGALANPIGDGATGLKVLAKGADAIGLGRAARVAAGGARKIEQAAVPIRAALAGGNQGALNAAGNADNLSDVPDALVSGGVVGGLAGGALGSAFHVGGKVLNSLRDAGAANAPRLAAQRIDELLAHGGHTPESAAAEVAATDAGNLNHLGDGQGAMLADLTPGLQAKAANVARRVDVPSSNALIERAQGRIADRGEQFANQVRRTADDKGGTLSFDAPEHIESVIGGRRAAGGRDYADGGAMDAPLHQSPEMEQFFRDMPPSTENAMRGAYNDMAEEMRAAGKALPNGGDPNSIFTHVPNMRTLDYALRRLNANAQAATRTNDGPLANRLGDQAARLRKIVGDANPDYIPILATQRTAFEQQRATELGKTALSRMMTDPRGLLKELKSRPDQIDDARIGIVDAIINHTRADPVALFASLTRTPAQEKVLSFALGGDEKLAAFRQYLTREGRANSLDRMNAPGKQSVTSTAMMGGGEDVGPATTFAQKVARGYAFGGVIGGTTAGMRHLAELAHVTNPATQEEIAQILLGKGEGLASRVQEARQFNTTRATRQARRAIQAAKVGQQGFTDMVGGH